MISVSIQFHSYNELPHTEVSSLYLVCSPPFQKNGGTQILKFSKKGVGEPEKIFWGGGNQRGRKIFKKKGGNPTFKAELRDSKEQK